MRRLLLAFTFAVLCHAAVFTVPFVNTNQRPRLISNASLTVTLSTRTDSSESKRGISDGLPALSPEKGQLEEAVPERKKKVMNFSIKPDKPKLGLRDRRHTVVDRIQPRKVKKTMYDIRDSSGETVEQKLSSPDRKTENDTARSSLSSHNRSESQLLPSESLSESESVVEAIPLYQHNPKPIYPTLARRRKWAGTVVIKVAVLTDGTSETCTLYESSGYETLDHSALGAVKKWRFLPGTVNGKPQTMVVLVPVHFVLE